MRVMIMRGIAGSGKSTFAFKNAPEGMFLVSADTYMVDENGHYQFSSAKLPGAHRRCLRAFLDHIQEGHSVVVDNTNTTCAELAPYVAIAQAYDYDVEIVTLVCDPKVAYERNTHDVPAHTVFEQDRKLRNEQLPPWWRHTVVFV